MYKILINDYINLKQTESNFNSRFLDAKENCLNLATEYVCTLEGLRYFRKPIFYKKGYLQKGYCLVDSSNNLFCKYTVYLQEQSGFVFSGKTKKIISFMTVKHQKINHKKHYSPPSPDFRNKYEAIITEINCLPLINDVQEPYCSCQFTQE